MMELRGYTPVTPQLELKNFDSLLSEWKRSVESLIEFRKINSPTTFAVFTGGKVNIARGRNVISAIENIRDAANKDKSKGVQHFNFVIITEELTDETKKALGNYSPPIFPRSDWNMNTPMIQVQVFYKSELQISVPDHVLQPYIALIEDEDEKESLRIRLVRDTVQKDTPLQDLLPLIRMTDPLVKWYNGRVGDIMYFVRTIGGKLPYWRYVVPFVQ